MFQYKGTSLELCPSFNLLRGKRHKTVECPSVRLSRRSTAAAAAGGFAAGARREQQIG